MHTRLALLLGTLCASGLGCGSWITAEAKTAIAQESQCPEDQINYSREGAIVSGEGCGRRVEVVRMCRYGDSDECLWRSVNELKSERLRARAAADFQCAGEALSVDSIDTRSWTANGCGQSATYLWSCPTRSTASRTYTGAEGSTREVSYADDCTWVMNSARN